MTAWLAGGLSNALVATLLAVAVWGITRIWRAPQLAFVLWLLVLVKLVAPPIWTLPIDLSPWTAWLAPGEGPAADVDGGSSRLSATSRKQRDGETAAPGLVSAFAPSALDDVVVEPTPAVPGGRPVVIGRAPFSDATWTPGPRWAGWLASTWLAGSALWFALAVQRIVRFKSLLRHAEPAHELDAEVAVLADRFGLTRVPDVRLVNRRVPPLVWAMTRRATVLLPTEFMRTLTAHERTTLLAHELAHVERGAGLLRWLEFVALGLYWWHPVVWWARRNVEQAEEHCCDARVVELLPDLARSYAAALLATVDFLSEFPVKLPLGASGFSQSRHLTRRMTMILAGTTLRRVGWPLRVAFAVAGLAVLPLSLRSVSAQSDGAPRGAKATTVAYLKDSLEERLDRLEKMVQTLTDEVQAMRKSQAEDASPVVIKTVPEAGATDVDPNLTEIKVTFSKNMKDGAWSWTQQSDDTFPTVTGKIHYLKDNRTCVLPVKLEPGKEYFIGINSERHRNFKDSANRPAIPFPLSFTPLRALIEQGVC